MCDGSLLTLPQLFNGYAEAAQYYDICLLIYHAADYHGPRVISETWQNLIDSAHDEVVMQQREWEDAGRPANNPDIVQPPLPYEHVMNKVQDIAHRTSLNDHVFPIDTVLSLLCRYAVEQQQDETIGADPNWPVLLFISLGVACATMARVLERILDAQEAPFTGRRRLVVVRWINEVLARWVRDVETQGAAGSIGRWVADLLARCDEVMEEVVQNEVRSQRQPSQAIQAVANRLQELQGWVQSILDGRGATGMRYFG